jgi:hypothetical protein
MNSRGQPGASGLHGGAEVKELVAAHCGEALDLAFPSSDDIDVDVRTRYLAGPSRLHRRTGKWVCVLRKGMCQADLRTGLESRRRWRTTLHPLTGPSGLSMIVLPVDGAGCPSKVFVVEPARPLIGTDGQPWGDGVLVYTVEARVPSGLCPVVVIPRIESFSDTYGDLYEAPYGEGDVAEVTDDGAQLTVAVTRRIGSAYEIEVTYRPV